MKIKELSNSTINRITAGEVIERPAAVVKELVENALDAGATKIGITIERAGKNLIVVEDNGCGMSREDLMLSVERHTTSKLDEDDIMNIRSLGFRGEALSSIGSVSRLAITTKTSSTLTASKITVEGGIKSAVEEDILNMGTRIEVRDLFFATPARLKFLKTDQSELSACVEIVKKLALSHPNVGFTLTSQGKTLIKTRSLEKPALFNDESNSKSDSLMSYEDYKYRIQELVGESFIQNSVPINFKDEELEIFGFTSLPTFNKATQSEQYLFVNNRPIKDKLLLTSIRVAYQDYISRDRFPVIVIFLNISPDKVDVNVHPAKAEVRFNDSNLIKNKLITALKTSLMNNAAFKASSSVAENTLKHFTVENKLLDNARSSQSYIPSNQNITTPISSNAPSILPKEDNSFFEYKTSYKNIDETIPSSHIKTLIEEIAPQSKTFDLSPIEELKITDIQYHPLGAACAHLHENYIISQTKDSIIIVDQHAAHERLIYEELKKTIAKNGFIKQRLLIPEIIELDNEFLSHTLEQNKTQLGKCGLTIDKFGEKSIIVSEIPSLLGEIDIISLINDLAYNLSEEGENISLNSLIESVTETYACHRAVRSGKKLNMHEANALLRQMEATAFSGQCNHGRPTYIELKLKDIEKLFGRI